MAASVLLLSGMSLAIDGFMRFIGLAALMFALSAWCRVRLPDPRLCQAAAIVGTATLGLMFAGVISNAGLCLGMPLADGWLAAADAALGFDAGRTTHAISEHPSVVQALSLAYNSSGIAVVALIFIAIARGDRAKAWELAATAVAAMQLVAILSPLAPAWGAMKHFSLEGLQGAGLPLGAGVYQWPAFAHFYIGGEPVLRLSDMGGVVAFPSFHTVLALMITQALGDTRLRWPAMAWTATIILSAIPMGGHYVVDLAAGIFVWLAAATVMRRVSSPSA